MKYTWDNNNLESLRSWLLNADKGKEIKIPDFLAFIAITTYQEKLKENQGELHNGHFTERALKEAIKEIKF